MKSSVDTFIPLAGESLVGQTIGCLVDHLGAMSCTTSHSSSSDAPSGNSTSVSEDINDSCAYDPKVRVGPTACPYTAGYWAFLERNAERLQDNRRMRQPLMGLGRLRDLEELVVQERERGDAPP